MAATFQWNQRNGVGGVSTDLGVTGNLWNFRSNDQYGIVNFEANPVTAGANSYEIVLRGHFDGSFSRISDVRFWMSTPYSPDTGLTVKFKGNQVIYLPPAISTSSIATSSIPMTDPGSANVSIAGSLTSCLTSSGVTDHLYLQLQTTVAAPPGPTSLAVYTMSYNEN